MPLTKKGIQIERNMEREYGSKKKAEQVLYASRNAGKISGIDEAEACSQAERLSRGESVSGRDRAKLKPRR